MPINNLSRYRNLGHILVFHDMSFGKFAEFAKTFFLPIQDIPFFQAKKKKTQKTWKIDGVKKFFKYIRDVIFINQALTASGRYFNHWSIFGWAQVQWDELSLAKTAIVFMWNKNVYYQLQIFTFKLVCFTGTVKKEQLKSFASVTFFLQLWGSTSSITPHVCHFFLCFLFAIFSDSWRQLL